ncbi:hypothetical protein [Brevibacillus laterosporus]|uniref:hypothetical protein n=1 Tax=Brevibacillus laterosporus TaxID=1465 RepID=UPI003D23D845
MGVCKREPDSILNSWACNAELDIRDCVADLQVDPFVPDWPAYVIEASGRLPCWLHGWPPRRLNGNYLRLLTTTSG